MPKIVELRPDKKLINSKFEKYQFCCDEIPIEQEINLQTAVRRLELTTNRDSLLETRLFAFHNHLFKNPYDASCWFINEKWIVYCLKKNGDLERMHAMHDSGEDVQNCLYNPSIGFTKNNIIAISDGGNCLKLLIKDNENHVKVFILHGAEAGVILDIQYVNTANSIVIAMCNIASAAEKKYTKLLLMTYCWKNMGEATEYFELVNNEVLKVSGAVEYMRIEEDGKHFHSICQDYITFECNTQKEITNEKDLKKDDEIKIPKYCWSQDEDSITVWLPVDKQDQEKIKVNVTALEILVTVNENILIQGQCQHRLDESLTTWNFENNKFKLEIYKYESGLMWNELIRGDTGCQCLPNESLAAEIHSKLAHLCTDQENGKQEQPCIGFNAEQLEECDVEGKDNLMQRINYITQENTHLAMLGVSNHVLFTNKTKSGQAICIRHDNDACVWITGQVNDNEWDIEHYYTFPGFGYVEASKSNRKFCVSPADGSYVAILEHTRYIFLYHKPELNTKVGKQWIVDLSTETCPIMGAAATNKYLLVLTKNKLYRLRISF